jgi:integrase
MARHRGLYRPTYRDEYKNVKESSRWWMRYTCRGCPLHPVGGKHRESTGKKKVTEAQRILDERRGTAAEGKPIIRMNEITMNQLLQGVLNDAQIRCKQSTVREYEDRIRIHLLPFFGNMRAIDICFDETIVRRFINQKKFENYSESTIDSMLTLITRSFTLAKNRIPFRPVFQKFHPENSRKTFFSQAEFTSLCRHLPNDVRRLIQVQYLTGWRFPSELGSRERRHVDWERGCIILEAGEAKNNQPRIFPFTSELRAVLEEQEAITKTIEKQNGILITRLFHHDGEPLARYYENRGCWKRTRYFLKSWDKACKASGLVGRIRHDFRRSAVRNFDKSLSDDIGMKLSGHKTHAIYRQYKALGEADVFEAIQKLEAGKLGQSKSKVDKKKHIQKP